MGKSHAPRVGEPTSAAGTSLVQVLRACSFWFYDLVTSFGEGVHVTENVPCALSEASSNPQNQRFSRRVSEEHLGPKSACIKKLNKANEYVKAARRAERFRRV